MKGTNPLTMQCTYSTPCGWCAKLDIKCDKKVPPRGLRAKSGIIFDETTTQSDTQEVIETIKSGKLPPLNTNSAHGLETRE